MLFDVVREFVAISNEDDVRGGRLKRAKELMTELRRNDFSGGEIAELSGGRWDSSTIRGSTVDWGGVKDSVAKTRIMGSLRELAVSGNTVGDIDRIIALERSVNAKSSSLVEVAELNANLKDFDMQPGEIGELLKLERDLMEEKLTPGAVRVWMVKDDELAKAGFDKDTRKALLDGCKFYGSLDNAFKAAMRHGHLDKILRDDDAATRNLDEISRLSIEEASIYNRHKEVNQSLALLIASGWNHIALILAPTVLKRSDTPEKMRKLIGACGEIEEMLANRDAVAAELAEHKKKNDAYLDPYSLALYQKLVAVAGNQLLPNVLVRDMRLFVLKLFIHYINAALKEKETTQDEKNLMKELPSYLDLLLRATPPIVE